MSTLTVAPPLGACRRRSSSADGHLIDPLRAQAHRLVAAFRRQWVVPTLAGLPDYLVRDIGLDGVDLDALDRAC